MKISITFEKTEKPAIQNTYDLIRIALNRLRKLRDEPEIKEVDLFDPKTVDKFPADIDNISAELNDDEYSLTIDAPIIIATMDIVNDFVPFIAGAIETGMMLGKKAALRFKALITRKNAMTEEAKKAFKHEEDALVYVYHYLGRTGIHHTRKNDVFYDDMVEEDADEQVLFNGEEVFTNIEVIKKVIADYNNNLYADTLNDEIRDHMEYCEVSGRPNVIQTCVFWVSKNNVSYNDPISEFHSRTNINKLMDRAVVSRIVEIQNGTIINAIDGNDAVIDYLEELILDKQITEVTE